MSRALQTYATKNDWYECLQSIETQRPLSYTVCGLFDTAEFQTFIGIDAIPNFGFATTSSAISEPCYLVCDFDLGIQTRPIPQRRGGMKYAIDQAMNPFTVGLKPGGLLHQDMLIAGTLGACTEHRASIELYNLLIREMKRRFARIKSYWVGPEAVQLLDRGGRLTVSDTTNTIYDLVR